MEHTTRESAEQVSHLRVVKKLARTDRGAIKLTQQFGETLVCVRHRVDAEAKHRFTTVELLVSKMPIEPKPKSEKLVAIKIDWRERALREIAIAAGAHWDGAAKVWRMPRRLAGILRLTSRIQRR